MKQVAESTIPAWRGPSIILVVVVVLAVAAMRLWAPSTMHDPVVRQVTIDSRGHGQDAPEPVIRMWAAPGVSENGGAVVGVVPDGARVGLVTVDPDHAMTLVEVDGIRGWVRTRFVKELPYP